MPLFVIRRAMGRVNRYKVEDLDQGDTRGQVLNASFEYINSFSVQGFRRQTLSEGVAVGLNARITFKVVQKMCLLGMNGTYRHYQVEYDCGIIILLVVIIRTAERFQHGHESSRKKRVYAVDPSHVTA
jgi:hypothetical protein